MTKSVSPAYFSRQVESAERFHFRGSAGKGVQIESGGREECSGHYQVAREHFPYYVLEFLFRGAADIQLGSASWTLSPGSVYVYHKELPHRLASASPEGMTKYFLIFKGAGARRLFMRHGIKPGHVIQVREFGRIAEIFGDLIRVGGSSELDRQSECLAMARYLLRKIGESSISQEHIAGGAYFAYLRCQDHLREHFIRLKTSSQIANECHLDPAYLSRLFRKFSGSTPYRLLLTLKMNYAADRLARTSVTAKELSDELGFAEPAVFSRSFKRVIGTSPSQSRQLLPK